MTMPSYINNLDKNAIENTKDKMREDFLLGEAVACAVEATWEEGVVHGADGKLVCHAPSAIQRSKMKQGPSMDSYCPLISGGCFCLVMMMDAAERGYHFDAVTSEMKTDAELIGFYKSDWEGTTNTEGRTVHHAWPNDIRLGIVIRGGSQSQEELNALADWSEDHCPSSEIMKREFPIRVNPFSQDEMEILSMPWDDIPIYYDMDRYHEIAKKDSFIVPQEAQMRWHCHNGCVKHPNALMTFQFPKDANAELPLGFDPPVGRTSEYANPVQACLFGGISSYLHTIAARLYVKGYKVAKLFGRIETKINKRKVFGVASIDFIFPEGARLIVDVVSNAPEAVLQEVQKEAERMSPTMMNWRKTLPFYYGIAKDEARTSHHRNSRGRRPSSDQSVGSMHSNITAASSSHHDDDDTTYSHNSDDHGDEKKESASSSSARRSNGGFSKPNWSSAMTRRGRPRLLNFIWKLTRPVDHAEK